MYKVFVFIYGILVLVFIACGVVMALVKTIDMIKDTVEEWKIEHE